MFSKQKYRESTDFKTKHNKKKTPSFSSSDFILQQIMLLPNKMSKIRRYLYISISIPQFYRKGTDVHKTKMLTNVKLVLDLKQKKKFNFLQNAIKILEKKNSFFPWLLLMTLHAPRSPASLTCALMLRFAPRYALEFCP